MKIAPIDINHKSFTKKLFGVDEEEVQEFLQQISHQMEELIKERSQLKEQLREKDLALAEYKERDQVLKSTIATAAQMAERLKQETEKESKLVVAEAHRKANEITTKARDALREMYDELIQLKKARAQFANNLKSLAMAHVQFIDESEKFLPEVNSDEKSTSVSPVATANQ